RGALLAELDRPAIGRIGDPDLLASGEAARAAFHFRQEQRAQRLAQRGEREMEKQAAVAPPEPAAPADGGANMASDMAAAPGENPATAKPKRDPGPGIPQQLYLEEAKARIDAALGADLGFVERLVWFWSNHFCVTADKGGVRPLAGAFEREAIRAHVLGRFADMLLAVESHPAMLVYLDNARSIGPDSLPGRNRGKGRDTTLAREVLELHTLGVRSVYTQDDVTRFAKVLTGWTMYPMATDPHHGNEFVFNARLHEPGPQTILGKVYPEGGVEQGWAVLDDLARHPATAAHVGRKLARHFCA